MLSALIRVTSLMNYFNKKVIFNFFIKEQFNYCVLLSMFRSRAVNHKIKIPEKLIESIAKWKDLDL